MAVTVVRTVGSTSHEPGTADRFEAANHFRVADDGHLILSGHFSDAEVIAVYAPKTWLWAYVDSSLKVVRGSAQILGQ